MSIEENKAVALCYLKDVLEQGHVELIESCYAPDGSVASMQTPDQFRDLVLWHQKYCPGYQITILELIAEGDKVMVNYRVDLTYSVQDDTDTSPMPPLGKPVSWRNNNVLRIEGGKIVSEQDVSGWMDMLVEIGVNPLPKTAQNRAAVRKFVDALNHPDTALLAEVCTPEVAKEWTEALPGMYASMKDHHIELVDMAADDESVAVKMATSGYHTGELFGIPATGKWWTNHGITFFYFTDGKIAGVDPVFDVENHIKQLGGVIRPAVA